MENTEEKRQTVGEFIAKVQKQLNGKFTQADLREVFNAAGEVIEADIAKTRTANVPGIGTLAYRHRKARSGYCAFNDQHWESPACAVPYIQPKTHKVVEEA